MNIQISPSNKVGKKLKAVINNSKIIHFGDSAYSDYTKHKDPKRKQNYISRHSNEDHTKSNIASAAFMSRHVLWNKPSIQSSINDLNRKYKDVNFKYKSSNY